MSLRQGSHLLVEQVLGLLPDPRISPVIQLKQTRQQSLAEHLRALPREERREVVNADHAEGRALGAGGEGDGDSGLVEGGGDIVDRDGVVGVRRVSAHVANNGQSPIRRGQALDIDERRDLGGEVDAVDEDVGLLDDFPEGTTLRGLCHVPLYDVGLGNPGVLGQLHGTLATASQLYKIYQSKTLPSTHLVDLRHR